MRVSAPLVAHAVEEVPLRFRAHDSTLFGVLCAPISPSHPSLHSLAPSGTRAVVCLPGGAKTSLAYNRFFVRLSRLLAEGGLAVLRFDYHGMGDSSGVAERFHLGAPFTEDVAGAVNCLAGRGFASFVLVGGCFGARTALAYAATDPRVDHLILFTPPLVDVGMDEPTTARTAQRFVNSLGLSQLVHRALRPRVLVRALKPEVRAVYSQTLLQALRHRRWRSRHADEWVSPHLVRDLSILAERGAQVLLVYGDQESDYQDLQRALDGKLGAVLRRNRGSVKLRTVAGRSMHGFTTVESQEIALDIAANYLRTATSDGPDRDAHGPRVD